MRRKVCKIIALIIAFNSFSSVVFADDTDIITQLTETIASEIVSDEETTEFNENTNVINLYVKKNASGEENTYKSISQVMSAVKAIDRSTVQVIVNIEGGNYDLKSPIVFDRNVSGSEEYPVIFKSTDDKEVVFNAGERVTGVKISDNDKIKNKLPQNVKNRVYKIDLSKYKSEQLGNPSSTGVNMGSRDTSAYGDMLEIIYDGNMMPRASYPNIGSEHIEKVNSTTVFAVENEDMPINSWDLSTGLGWTQVIAENGYIYGQGKLIGYDAASRMITSTIGDGWSYGVGGRVRFKNLPELIDQPGEYSVDFNNLCIYFYPPDEHFGKAAYITSFKEPIVQFDGASNIILDDITIQNGGDDGVMINSSQNCVISNSIIKNLSGNGVQVINSKNISIDSCCINNIGLNGIYLEGGGNYKTLTSSGNNIRNCDIYTVGRTAPVGNPGILARNETGTKIINNRVHDTPHDAIRLDDSTACVVERNEVYNAVNDTYDAGAIYNGGQTFMGTGNIFKENYIHDIYLSSDAKGGAVMALYWDDQQSGNTAVNNIFDDNQFCMLVGGGDWNTVENNIFFNSRASLTVDARGEGWQKALEGAEKVRLYESEIGVGNKVWEQTYPYTTKLYNYGKENNMDKINAPDESIIRNNIMIGTPLFSLANSAVVNAVDVSNNERKDDDFIAFEEPHNYDFKYSKETAPNGYDYIEFEKIGINNKSLSKPTIIGPCDGAENLEGNDIVLSWKDTNGADKYRVKISMDKEMKALIYDEIVKGESVHLDNLKYGKTFYWTVQPIKSSKSENDGYESDVNSFTTTKNEKKDTSKLDKLLTSLGNGWRRVIEGKRPGMYQEGAIAGLDKVVAEAETVFYNNASKMFTVKSVTSKLENAIAEFNDKMNIETVEVGDWLKDKQHWTDTGKDKIDGEVMYLHSSVDGGNASYTNAQLSGGQLLKFKVKMDLTNFQMFGLNADEPTGYAWARNGYSIVVKRDAFEVQKRYMQNGSQMSQIIKTFKNEESIMTSDVWHTVEIGLLSTVQGPRILMKVDGKVAVDYIDESDIVADALGYFIFSESSGGIGMTIAPSYYEGE